MLCGAVSYLSMFASHVGRSDCTVLEYGAGPNCSLVFIIL